LPEAAQADRSHAAGEPSAHENLLEKGLPALAVSKIRVTIILITKKVWNFILEAKDLKPHSAAGYQMKKIFGGKLPGVKKDAASGPLTTAEVRNEQYYLDRIKLQPKNLAHYDELGKYYLDQGDTNDAKDIYLYAVNHEPGNPDYQARLAYCFYIDKDFAKAAQHYQKAVALDSTQPNRYYNLGLSLQAAGDSEQALKAMHKALELEPSNPKYIQGLKKIQKK
jgi:tetratricopeptide (TPR) repeat protein